MNGPLYDFVIGFFERRMIGPLRRDLLTQVHGEVADVGAGTGANFAYYPSDAHVLALEPDSSMAQRARCRIRTASARIELRIDDDRFLDTLSPGSLDAVVLTLVLCSVDDPEVTLRRARRALKPEGTLILLEHVRSRGGVGRFQDFIAPLWQRAFGGCHLNRDTDAAAATAGFDTSTLQGKALPRLSPVQKLIYGSLHLRSSPPSNKAK